jgi:CheY-like chemotaxis protein
MARVVVAGLDAREIALEVRVLQRGPAELIEALSARELFDALAREGAALVVLGPRLPDVPLVEAIREIRSRPARRRVSILALLPADEAEGADGAALEAGANAVLRRPLERLVLESWVAKLLDVPRRAQARVPVHLEVAGTARGGSAEHFYGLSRNLSIHGLLLASPVRLEGADVDLEVSLPEPQGRVRALGRVVREAPEVAWPYRGYGIEFVLLPPTVRRAIERVVRGQADRETTHPLWGPGFIHSTIRRQGWIYELGKPTPGEEGFLVEIRRATIQEWRPGATSPFYVVAGASASAALDSARDFVRRHG